MKRERLSCGETTYSKLNRKNAAIAALEIAAFLRLTDFYFCFSFILKADNPRQANNPRAPPHLFFLVIFQRKGGEEMILRYKFRDGAVSETEIEGDFKVEYCKANAIDPENAPEVILLSEESYSEREGRSMYRRHKYTGDYVSLEFAAANGEEAADNRDDYAALADKDEMEKALSTLTDLQRFCFVEVCLKGLTQQTVAEKANVSRESVKQAIFGAKKKLKKFFS